MKSWEEVAASVFFSPQFAQGVLTFLAALFAGWTALRIASRIYPRQKDKDRQVAMAGEKAEAIVVFFRSIEQLVNASVFEGVKQAELVIESKSALNRASLYVTPDTAASFWQLYLRAIEISSLKPGRATAAKSDEIQARVAELTQFFRQSMDQGRRELGNPPLSHSLSVIAIFGEE